MYFGMATLWCLLIAAGYLVIGKSVFALLRLAKEPMLIAFCTSSSEASYPKTIEQLTSFGVKQKISTFVLPLAYSFNLDGSMMFQAFASLFIAQAFNIHLSWEQQLSMLFVMLLTSKGIAGVPRASMVVVAATRSVSAFAPISAPTVCPRGIGVTLFFVRLAISWEISALEHREFC